LGYTHYHPRAAKLDAQKFSKFSRDCKLLKRAAEAQGVKVRFEYDVPRPAVFSEDVVRFNGINDDGHETFYLPLETHDGSPYDGRIFAFCKTARKPYDLLVTACLIMAKHHFGKDVCVTSDGEQSDWDAGRGLCLSALGHDKPFKLG